MNIKKENTQESRLNISNKMFQKQNKHKMIFYIEEVSDQDAIYSYQCSCIFDELLEFYAFMTQFAVEKVQNDDSTEKYYYKHAKAVEL